MRSVTKRIGTAAILTAVLAGGPVLAGSVDEIGRAGDPSAAIQIYVNAPDRSSLEVERAYVRRLQELGTPELAEAQAKDVVARDPRDVVGWAALSETNAKRGNMPEAMKAMSNVAGQPVEDPLAQAAAGRLVAWYQIYGNSVQVDAGVKQKMEDLNRQLGEKQVYADSMKEAREAYAKQSAAPAPTAQGAPPAQGAQSAQGAQPAQAAPAQAAPVANVAPVQQAVTAAQPLAAQPSVGQQSVYQPGAGAPIQNNPGPAGGTPINPPQQTQVTSADVNIPQQREWVSGDTVYQGATSQEPAYSGAAVGGSPAYVGEPVYAPSPAYYYEPYPYTYGTYYYGPSVYIYGGSYYHHDYWHDHDWHDDHRWDHAHPDVHGHGDFDQHGVIHHDAPPAAHGAPGPVHGPVAGSPRSVAPTQLPNNSLPATPGRGGDSRGGDSHGGDSRGGDGRGGDGRGGDGRGGGGGRR